MNECKQCKQLAEQVAWFSFALGAMSTLALESGAEIGNVETLMRVAFQQSPINEDWSPSERLTEPEASKGN